MSYRRLTVKDLREELSMQRDSDLFIIYCPEASEFPFAPEYRVPQLLHNGFFNEPDGYVKDEQDSEADKPALIMVLGHWPGRGSYEDRIRY